ncbi:hypothetical protein M0R45_020863 [Rubus argutus]|uniref:Uncharacterized protein n=1 Tax=Rubus argutus TaxID=59490 RepID=A0AAW1XAS9_RUBAR
MVKVKGDEERSLYICTVEELESPIRRRYRIHSITLSDLLSKRSIELQKSLHEVARLEGPDLPLHMDCSIYGSQIIFTGVVELASPPLTDSSDSEDREPSSDDNNDSSDDRGERIWRTNVGYQVYELIAYRMLNDDYSIERIRAFDPSIITSWGWDIGYDAPLKYSFAHLGGRRVCLTEARFVSHETQKHGIGMMRLFVSTFEFSFEDGNDGSRSFSVKSLLDYSADSSRIFQLLLDDPQESGDATLLNAQLLGCFVL